MKVILSAFFWVSVYLALVLTPMVALKIGEVPPSSGFWWDFALTWQLLPSSLCCFTSA